MRYAILPVFFIKMDNSFCVAVAAVPMAPFFQLLTEFQMIVDLTVEDKCDRIILIRDRLMTRLYVDDAQPAHCHADIVRKKEASVIGTPMNDLAVHFFENAALGCPVTIKVENAADSAHSYSILLI
jgi:hypothetical protein